MRPRCRPSPRSAWPGLATLGQLSVALATPSPSRSESHASPVPSESRSAWPGLATSGQLSVALATPSPSRSESHASPVPSESRSACPGLATSGQLSVALETPSPSRSESHASPSRPRPGRLGPGWRHWDSCRSSRPRHPRQHRWRPGRRVRRSYGLPLVPGHDRTLPLSSAMAVWSTWATVITRLQSMCWSLGRRARRSRDGELSLAPRHEDPPVVEFGGGVGKASGRHGSGSRPRTGSGVENFGAREDEPAQTRRDPPQDLPVAEFGGGVAIT